MTKLGVITVPFRTGVWYRVFLEEDERRPSLMLVEDATRAEVGDFVSDSAYELLLNRLEGRLPRWLRFEATSRQGVLRRVEWDAEAREVEE